MTEAAKILQMIESVSIDDTDMLDTFSRVLPKKTWKGFVAHLPK